MQIKADDPGALRLHAEADEELAQHLCAEIVDAHGLWQNPGNKANHLWDCAIMALVAEDVLQLKFRQPEAQIPPPPPKKQGGPNPYTGGRRYYG